MPSCRPRPRPATTWPDRGRGRARAGCGAPLRAPPACRQTARLVSGSAAALDGLLQRRAGTEPRDLAGRDLDPLTRLRVDALAGAALRYREVAEAGEVHFSPTPQRFLDDAQNGVDGLPGLALAEAARIADLIDELTLRHGNSSSVAVRTSGHANHDCGQPQSKIRIQSGFFERKCAICGVRRLLRPAIPAASAPEIPLKNPKRPSRHAAAEQPGRSRRRAPSAARSPPRGPTSASRRG